MTFLPYPRDPPPGIWTGTYDQSQLLGTHPPMYQLVDRQPIQVPTFHQYKAPHAEILKKEEDFVALFSHFW